MFNLYRIHFDDSTSVKILLLATQTTANIITGLCKLLGHHPSTVREITLIKSI